MARTDEHDERTQQATARRLAELKRRGLRPRSADLTHALVALAGMAALGLCGHALLTATRQMTAALLSVQPAVPGDLDAVGSDLGAAIRPLAGMVVPLAGVMVVLAITANMVQVGFRAAGERIGPDFGRLLPGAGLKRMLSRRSLVRLVMALAKLTAVVGIGWWTVAESIEGILGAGGTAAGSLPGRAGELVLRLGLRVAAALAGLAVLDWLYQRWEFAQQHKMTPREVAEDLRRAATHEAMAGRRGAGKGYDG